MRRRQGVAMAATVCIGLIVASCSTSSDVSSVEANRTDTNRPETSVDDDPVGCPTTARSTGARATTSRPAASRSSVRRCAVPLDHDDPDGATIDIAVARVPATDPDERIGSLVFNPGGPGGSGIDFVSSAAVAVPAEISERFDLVGFDPRGVGASTAVDCDVEIDDNVDLLEAGDDAGWQELLDEAAGLDDDLPVRGARARPVRRHEQRRPRPRPDPGGARRRAAQLRRVLLRHPARRDVRRAVPRQRAGARARRRRQADRRLRRTRPRAGRRVRPGARELRRRLRRRRGLRPARARRRRSTCTPSRSTRSPRPAASRPTTRTVCSRPANCSSASPPRCTARTPGRTSPRRCTSPPREQDGTLLQVLGDGQAGRQPDGTYNNEQEANLFINCADDPNRPDADAQRVHVRRGGRGLGVVRRLPAGDAPAASASPDAIDPLVLGPADGAAPILVIGSTGDPATPYDWSVGTRRLVVVGGAVHRRGRGPHGLPERRLRRADRGRLPRRSRAARREDDSCSDNDTADFFPPPGRAMSISSSRCSTACARTAPTCPNCRPPTCCRIRRGDVIFENLDPTDPEFAAGRTRMPGHHRRPLTRFDGAVPTASSQLWPVVHNESPESHTQSALTLHRVRRS